MGLDQTDLNTLNTLKAAGVPIVVVLVSGRPLEITAQLPGWRALVAAWLPGTEGQGVSDILFGDYKPTGKLPVTWASATTSLSGSAVGMHRLYLVFKSSSTSDFANVNWFQFSR